MNKFGTQNGVLCWEKKNFWNFFILNHCYRIDRSTLLVFVFAAFRLPLESCIDTSNENETTSVFGKIEKKKEKETLRWLPSLYRQIIKRWELATLLNDTLMISANNRVSVYFKEQDFKLINSIKQMKRNVYRNITKIEPEKKLLPPKKKY